MVIDWRIALTLAVAALLTWLTFLSWRSKNVPSPGAKRAFLRLLIPATVWAWESTLREMLSKTVLPRIWPILDVLAGGFALLGVLTVIFWIYRGGRK